MATATPTAPPAVVPISTHLAVLFDRGALHVVMEGVSWKDYENFLEETTHRRLRTVFDRGEMEVMSPYYKHEMTKTGVARLIELYASLRGIALHGAGQLLMKDEKLAKGLEPDECYYVQTTPVMIEGDFIVGIHPPPDLAIEIDSTRSSIPRQPIYAALKVKEIWMHRRDRLTVLLRQADGTYRPTERSLALSELPMEAFNAFVKRFGTETQPTVIADFMKWIDAGCPA